MGHSFDMLTFDFLLKPPQPFTGLFFFCRLIRLMGSFSGYPPLEELVVLKGP